MNVAPNFQWNYNELQYACHEGSDIMS